MNKYKYSDLHGKIVAKYGTLIPFANDLGISKTSITNKLLGRTPWKTREISAASDLLGIKKDEIPIYFLF